MDHQEEILKLEREQLKFQKDNLSLFQDLVKGQAAIKVSLADILHHHGKQAMIVLLITFLGGIIIGTQYMSWLPFIGDIMNTAKGVNGVIK